MYQKITLGVIFISSISLAHNLPKETLCKLKELNAQEKHRIEKEKAFRNLKIGGIAITAAIATFIGTRLLLHPEFGNGFDELKKLIGNKKAGYALSTFILLDFCIAGYGVYKTAQGGKDLLFLDHPNPEEKTKATHE